MSHHDTALDSDTLVIGYKESGQKVAENLSVSLKPGEFVSLLGPNGVGKSTLIRTLAGIDDPLEGRVFLKGEPLSDLTPKERARRISVVLADALPGAMLSVYGLIALGRHPYTGLMGGLATDDKERVDWAIETMGIQDLANRRFGEISDGERQKALIARALAQEADVLLLDEPTAFVDLPSHVEIVNVLRELAHSQGLAVMASSHDLELSLSFSDKLWLMDLEGKLTNGVPEDLVLQGSVARLFQGEFSGWDAESGSFRVRKTPARFARVSGDGETCYWVRRALERVGFGIRDDDEVALEVSVGSDTNSCPIYQAIIGDRSKTFTSLGDLLAWIGRMDRAVSGHRAKYG